MAFNWNHVETNRPESDLTVITPVDCTFDSTDSTDILPAPFHAADFVETAFTYGLFGFLNSGSGSAEWISNEYNYGISGTLRAGIGFFYFYEAYPPFSSDFSSVGEEGCHEDDFGKIKFWDYISTFWNFLDDPSRDMVENFWYGLVMAGGSLTKKGQRYLTAVSPQLPETCVFEDFYDLKVGPMVSRPVYLDPTERSPKTIINPIGTVLVEPEYDGFDPIYSDLIEVTGNDYQKIRQLGTRINPDSDIVSDCYVIVQPKDTSIDKKYFNVTNFFSSEEAYDRYASAFIDNSLITQSDIESYVPDIDQAEIDAMGTLKITGNSTDDISQYKVSISYAAGAATVVWSSDRLDITVDRGVGDQIAAILAALPGTGAAPWATITNASAPLIIGAPIISNIDFEDLYSYVNAQVGANRYYPDAGKVWKWYDGWNTSNGTGVQGEWVESKSKFKYMIEVDGSLNYLGSTAFSIYFTTGRAYDIAREIIDIPYLTSGIGQEEIYFRKEPDYIINGYVLEFLTDIFVNKEVIHDTIFYCKKTPIIENFLFEQYGGMVSVRDWNQFNYRNISGKAAINTLISSIRNISSLEEYEKALNIYYGLPVPPERSRVVGVFESFGYKILEVSDNTVTVEIKDGEEIHPFVQNQCIMVNGVGTIYVVSGMNPDRSLGKFNVADPDGLVYGDRLCVRLNNRFELKNVNSEPYIDVYIREGYKPIKHVIDTVHEMYGTWPEILIYGTDKFETNFDGLYHAIDAYHPEGEEGSVVRIELYRHEEGTEPMYNDYIGSNVLNIGAGYAHLPWPTHKFLYLYLLGSKKLYRAYMDSPMDTIYDSGDALEQYQAICRNASVMNQSIFGEWNQYRNFRRSPGINSNSDIIEMIFADPSAEFGQYFPSGLYRD